MSIPLSASQISLLFSCERKWGARYLQGLPDPAGAGAALGSRVHNLLEHYLKSGKVPEPSSKAGRMALAALPYLPPPPQHEVEKKFAFELEGITWRGAKDLTFMEGDTHVVHDHKTTSDLKWQKDLNSDIQGTLYTKHAYELGHKKVALNWLYITSGTDIKVLPVRYYPDPKRVEANLIKINAGGQRALLLYEEKPNWRTLEPNLEMCGAFGGCPFRAECKPDQHNSPKDTTMGFRDRNKPTSIVPEVPDLEVNQPTRSVAEVNQPARLPMADRLRQGQGFGSAVVPPSVTKSVPPPADLVRQVADAIEADPELAAQILPPAHPAVADTEPAPAPKKRGRPPGSTNKKHQEPTAADESESTLSGHTWADIKEAAGITPRAGYTLYVNCYPTKAAPTVMISLSDLLDLADLLQNIQDRTGLDHYRLIDYKADGTIGAELYTYLKEHPINGGIFVDSRTNEGRDCLPTLERFANAVVRGL